MQHDNHETGPRGRARRRFAGAAIGLTATAAVALTGATAARPLLRETSVS
jgi:hypothetical protein